MPRLPFLRVAGPLIAIAMLAGCGSTGQTTTVVRKVVVEKTVRAGHGHTAAKAAAPAGVSSASTTAPSAPAGEVACDANIRADASSTSCGFAENVFYEYWKQGEAGSFTAYSPATGSSYAVSCAGGDEVDCTTASGAEVQFPAAAVDAYTPAQASRYAAGHNVGSDPPPPPASPASTASADFCTTHDCIPSFDEGRGSIVQCEDGEWSHSGGISGACSSHGGETSRTYP